MYTYIQKGIHILEYSNVFYQAQCMIWPILPSFYKGELFLPHTYQGKTQKVGKTTNISFFGWLILNSERKIVKILHCAAAAQLFSFFSSLSCCLVIFVTTYGNCCQYYGMRFVAYYTSLFYARTQKDDDGRLLQFFSVFHTRNPPKKFQHLNSWPPQGLTPIVRDPYVACLLEVALVWMCRGCKSISNCSGSPVNQVKCQCIFRGVLFWIMHPLGFFLFHFVLLDEMFKQSMK